MVAQLNSQLQDKSQENQMLAQRMKFLEQEYQSSKQNEAQYFKHYEGREDEFMQLLQAGGEMNLIRKEERQRIQGLLSEIDYFQKELSVKEDTNRKLEDNINTLNKVVDDQAKRMEAEKEGYRELQDKLMKKEQKCEEILKEFQLLEQRHTKVKARYETENAQLKEERAKYLGKYKNKLHSLKPELKEKDGQMNQMRMENLRLKNENDQIQSVIKQLESQLGQLSSEVPIIERQNNQMSGEVERLTSINQQMTEALEQQQRELNEYQQQLQSAINNLEKLTQQYERLKSDNEKLKEVHETKVSENKQNKDLIEKICEIGHSQMDDMDGKVQKMNQQMQQLTHEKKMLAQEIVVLRQEVQQNEVNEQALERRIVKLRKENKELRRSLNEMNVNLKDMIVEKHSEIRNSSMAHPKSHNASYRSLKNKDNVLLSSNTNRDFFNLDDSLDDDDDL